MIARYPGVDEVNVYGVKIGAMDGRAGMADGSLAGVGTFLDVAGGSRRESAWVRASAAVSHGWRSGPCCPQPPRPRAAADAIVSATRLRAVNGGAAVATAD